MIELLKRPTIEYMDGTTAVLNYHIEDAVAKINELICITNNLVEKVERLDDNIDRYNGPEQGEDGEFEETDTVGDPLLNDE